MDWRDAQLHHGFWTSSFCNQDYSAMGLVDSEQQHRLQLILAFFYPEIHRYASSLNQELSDKNTLSWLQHRKIQRAIT